MEQLQSISFHSLTELISPRRKQFKKFKLNLSLSKDEERPFSYLKPKVSNYIEPTLSRQLTANGMTNPNEAQIILISAPAATGKSVMTTELSSRLGIPCFNLALNEPVGKDSLIGMLYHTLQMTDLPEFLMGLKNGEQSMIIDALDEGAIATGQAPFDSFLKDIADLARDAKGIPFIIMGRTSSLEYASLVFEDLDVPVSWLKIDPFKHHEALKFITLKLNSRNFENLSDTDPLKMIVKFIFESLGQCIMDDVANQKIMSDFLGYAPVLDTIVEMLKDQANPLQLLEDLKSKDNRNIPLLQDIVERIMDREQEKFLNAIDQLLNKYPQSLKINLYSRTEQIMRLMYGMVKTPFEAHPTDDIEFNREYNARASDWFGNHPFFTGRRIENPVFEAYVLAHVAEKGNMQPLLDQYLGEKTTPSLFFDFFRINHSEKHLVDPSLIRYLIASFQEDDNSEARSMVEIYEDTESAIELLNKEEFSLFNKKDKDIYRIEFTRAKENEGISMFMHIPSKNTMRLGKTISRLTIDAPINIQFENRRTEFCAPVDINVNSLIIKSNELVFTPGINNQFPQVLISSTFLSTRLESGIQQVVKKGDVKINISTDSQLYFPLVEYKSQLMEKDELASINDLFPKFRRLILYFRANGKDEMGRFKAKIDNLIAGNTAGSRVLNALMDRRIITSGPSMYYLDTDSLSKLLNTNFAAIRSCIISPQLKEFLSSLTPNENC
ncbi:MAG: hypothetical protein HDS49_05735 [Bacteroides sp.]|nr:hypothetical protein [Bacteroides sp.]